jgi:hypothetical protein
VKLFTSSFIYLLTHLSSSLPVFHQCPNNNENLISGQQGDMESRTVSRVRALFRQQPSQEYERIEEDPNDEDVRRPVLVIPDKVGEEPFSWFEYSIFVLLGVAMLWAWYDYSLQPIWPSANTPIGTCF